MWLITPEGFFTIVEKAADKAGGTLTIRESNAVDLDAVGQGELEELGPTTEGAGADYHYRATAPRQAVAVALGRIAEGLHYSSLRILEAREIRAVLNLPVQAGSFRRKPSSGPLAKIGDAPRGPAWSGGVAPAGQDHRQPPRLSDRAQQARP